MMGTDIWSEFPVLETSRFRLREIMPDDDEVLFAILSDQEVMRYWSSAPYTSIDQARRLIEVIRGRFREKAAIEWGIVAKDSGRLAGKCSFHRWHKDHFRAEVGYVLARESWGGGVMMEVLPAVLRYGFDGMSLHSVEAMLDPENTRSKRVLERLGFTKEGHLRENFYLNGKFSDTAIYSLLKSNAPFL